MIAMGWQSAKDLNIGSSAVTRGSPEIRQTAFGQFSS